MPKLVRPRPSVISAAAAAAAPIVMLVVSFVLLGFIAARSIFWLGEKVMSNGHRSQRVAYSRKRITSFRNKTHHPALTNKVQCLSLSDLSKAGSLIDIGDTGGRVSLQNKIASGWGYAILLSQGSVPGDRRKEERHLNPTSPFATITIGYSISRVFQSVY